MEKNKSEIIIMKLSEIKYNPDNPRLIKDDKFKKLVASIKEFPEMLKIRPVVINKGNMILGGNMRLKACQEAGLKEIPVIKVDNLTPEQEKEFIIKDNISFGEWNFDILTNEWEKDSLNEWGMDLPIYNNEKEQEFKNENKYFINIECDNERHAQKLYERFIKENLNVKIIT